MGDWAEEGKKEAWEMCGRRQRSDGRPRTCAHGRLRSVGGRRPRRARHDGATRAPPARLNKQEMF